MDTSFEKENKRKKRNYRSYKHLYMDKNGNKLNEKIVFQNCRNYLKNTIIPDLLKKKLIKLGRTPKIRILDENNYRGFTKLIDKYPFTWNSLLIDSGFKINHDNEKYKPLYTDHLGKKLQDKEILIKCVNFLVTNIIPYLLSIKKLKKNETPTYDLIKYNGFRGFLNIIDEANFKFNDVLKTANLEINYSGNIYVKLYLDENHQFLDKEKIINNFSSYLEKSIIPVLCDQNIIKDKDDITTIILEKNGYRGFIAAYIKCKLEFSEILTKIGIYNRKDWKPLYLKENGEILVHQKVLENCTKLINEVIIPDLIEREVIDSSYINLTKEILEENGYRGFYHVIQKTSINWDELLVNSGIDTNEVLRILKIGKCIHIIIELIFLKHTSTNNCKSNYEIMINNDSKNGEYSQNRCDNAVEVDENLKLLLNKSPKFEKVSRKILKDNIDLIVVDYFIGSSDSTVINHCLRGYQAKNRFLLLIPFLSKKMSIISRFIPYSENIFVIDPMSFCKLFNFSNNYIEEIKYLIKLTNNAKWDDESLNILLEWADESRKKLNLF